MKCKIELELDVEMKDEKNIQEYSDLLQTATNGVMEEMKKRGVEAYLLDRELIAENGNVAKTIRVEIPNKEEDFELKYYAERQKVYQLEKEIKTLERIISKYERSNERLSLALGCAPRPPAPKR